MTASLRHPSPAAAAGGATAAAIVAPAAVWAAWVQSGLDAARHQHALAVRAGALPRSALGSARFEAWLDSVERLALGRLARRV